MAIRMKFRVVSKSQVSPTELPTGNSIPAVIPTTIKLAALKPSEGEKTVFNQEAPAGLLELVLEDDAASHQLEVGRAYFLSIAGEFEQETATETPEGAKAEVEG